MAAECITVTRDVSPHDNGGIKEERGLCEIDNKVVGKIELINKLVQDDSE